MFAPARSPPTLFTLVFLTALSVLSLNMFLPSLATMADEFAVTYKQAGLAISGYLALTAVLQIIFGPLSDRYGRRPVLLFGLSLFTMASLGALLSANIWWFLVFRIAQGAAVSAMALSRAIVRDIKPPQEAASMLGYIGMAMAVAPMLGPAFGGLLEQGFGWRASFVAYTVLGVVAVWLVWSDLGETNTNPSETFRQQFMTYPELLASRRFWGFSLCQSFSVGGFYAYIAAMPSVAGEFGFAPALIGLSMGAPTFGFFFGNMVTGRLSGRFQLLTLTLAGRLVASVGLSLGLIAYLVGVEPIVAIFLGVICLGFGNGLTIPTATVGVMSVRPRLAGSASGLSGAMAVAIGAVITWTMAAILPETGGTPVMLMALIAIKLISLGFALYVGFVDRREGPPVSG